VSTPTEPIFSLEGRVAVLTGASGFLGRTMAEGLLSHGARVVVLGRSSRLDEHTSHWVDRFGAERVVPHRVDFDDENALRSTLAVVLEQGPVDVLVNNAHELGPSSGFNVPSGSLEETDRDQWLRHVGGGLWWAAVTTQAIGARMKETGRGSIINVSSMYGLVAPSPRLYEGTSFVNPPGYSAAKAALLALTRYTASYYGPHGVRANALVPGPFSNTEDAGPNAVAPDDPFLDRLRERTCLGRVGEAAELIGPLLFLATDASSYVTGHALVVDGGWTIV
jgi:NAD(P)-dependent dehydrogenase (short-subunit alcohol dehydrogenase family)